MICNRCDHEISSGSDYDVENQQHYLQDCFEYVISDRDRFSVANANNLAGWENERNNLIDRIKDLEGIIRSLKQSGGNVP